MPYIVCNECGGYYELEEGESLEDFDRCQCGGALKHVSVWGTENRRFSSDLSYAESAQADQKAINKQKSFIQCSICGQNQEKKAVICSKCGSILRRRTNSRNRYDYQHVIKQSKKKNFFDMIEWWGVASGIIFLIVAYIISSILIFLGLFRIATQNASGQTAFAFLGGSLLVSIVIMILSGFIAVAAIKTRDYIAGIINGGLVGVFIGILAGTFALLFIALVAGILGQGNLGLIGGLAALIGYVIIYGALTAFGGLIAIYVRRHTSII